MPRGASTPSGYTFIQSPAFRETAHSFSRVRAIVIGLPLRHTSSAEMFHHFQISLFHDPPAYRQILSLFRFRQSKPSCHDSIHAHHLFRQIGGISPPKKNERLVTEVAAGRLQARTNDS